MFPIRTVCILFPPVSTICPSVTTITQHKKGKPEKSSYLWHNLPSYNRTQTMKKEICQVIAGLKEIICKAILCQVKGQVQGAAISIYIAAPCTCKIHSENQQLTNHKNQQCNLVFCTPHFHPVRSPSKSLPNKKIPSFISCFQSNSVYLYQVIRAERRNAKNPAPLLIRYLLPNFLLFTS